MSALKGRRGAAKRGSLSRPSTPQPTPRTSAEVEETQALVRRSVDPIEQHLITRIHDKEELDVCRIQQLNLVRVKKELTFRKESITKPLNEALKNTRDLFRPMEERVEGLLSKIKSTLTDYDTWVREELDRKREKLEERVESGRLTEGQAGAQVARTSLALGAPNMPMRSVPTVLIYDEAIVPRKYWVVDEVLVRKDVKELTEGREIPEGEENALEPIKGVKVYKRRVAVNA